MKRFFNLLATLALVVSMLGCSGGPTPEPELPSNPDTPTPSTVQLRLKGDIANIKPSTRVDANGFEANDKVGVYVSSTSTLHTTTGNMLNNEAFTYSSGNIIAPEGKEVYWGTPDVRLSVWAYYPYTEGISYNANHRFAVAEDQSDAEDFYNSDFIIAQKTNLAPQADAVNLTFNHSLSKIAVTLEAGSGITDEELAEAEKSFLIKGLVTDGTIDLATGTATAGTTTATITPLESAGVNYAAIVYPQQGAVTFCLEMDGDIYTYTTNIDYTAGLQYDYKLTINVSKPQEMTLNGTTITPWGEGESHAGVMSDIISISDPEFKAFLLSANIYEFQPDDSSSRLGGTYTDLGIKIDANNDGEISISEAERVIYLWVVGTDITDLSALKHFPNLRVLQLFALRSLSHIDLSQNSKLQFLECTTTGKLTHIDISHNQDLEYLFCYENKITNLDVSKNLALKLIDCHQNELSSLNVSNNTALESLNCGSNQLTELDITNNKALKNLNYYNTGISSLDVSKHTALEYLHCGGNQTTTLDISKNTALKYLNCYNNQLTSLDISHNIALEEVYCESNQLTTLDVSKNLALTRLFCNSNLLTSLDISKNTALKLLHCSSNQLTALDVTTNTALTEIWCTGNRLSTLDVSNITALEILKCNDNPLENLYLATEQHIKNITKPDQTEIVYK